MQKISDPEILTYFKKALSRSFIHLSSLNFPDINISTREIFTSTCPIMSDWYSLDVSKSYSAFQYLEGCLLIEEIFNYILKNKNTADFCFVFAIPNDESKYYKDENSSFQRDIEYLITKNCSLLNIKNINLDIKSFLFNTAPNLINALIMPQAKF